MYYCIIKHRLMRWEAYFPHTPLWSSGIPHSPPPPPPPLFFFFFKCPWCIIDSPLQLGPWNLLVSLPALCTLQPTSHKLQVAFLDSKFFFLPPLSLSCSLCLECSLSRPSEGLFSKRIPGSPPMLVFFNLLSTVRYSYLSLPLTIHTNLL